MRNFLLFLLFFGHIELTAQNFIPVAQKAIPAVVSIQTKSSTQATNFFDGNINPDDFFGRFFGFIPKGGPTPPQISQASGFLISENGYILTNNHVVSGAESITIKLNDGREYLAKLIGGDSSTDLALIKIDADKLPYLTLGNSDALQVGQWVVAIGAPLGLQASLTVGVVSAKGRSNLDLARIEDFIQTDAAINRGNSGGPLLDLSSEVIGINTAIATNYANGGYMGIGFAIPSNMARHVVEQLKSTGKVIRGYLGVSLQPVDSDLAQAFGLEKPEGALITDVLPRSPAAAAGLQRGDIITKIDGQPIDTVGTLRNTVALRLPNSSLTLTLLRNKHSLEVQATIGTLPDKEAAPLQESHPADLLGIEVAPEGDHLLITHVAANSLAAWAGIQKGMTILAVNNHKVSTREDFLKEVKNRETDKPLVLLIQKGDAVRYISLRL